MKIIGLEIKNIGIGKFFPKEDKIELEILFNDGNDKEIFKIVDTSDAVNSAEGILIDLRKMEKNIHKNIEGGEFVVDNHINIVIKNEEKLIKEISEYIQQISVKMEEIKQKSVADGYLDLIRELKNLKMDFTS